MAIKKLLLCVGLVSILGCNVGPDIPPSAEQKALKQKKDFLKEYGIPLEAQNVNIVYKNKSEYSDRLEDAWVTFELTVAPGDQSRRFLLFQHGNRYSDSRTNSLVELK